MRQWTLVSAADAKGPVQAYGLQLEDWGKSALSVVVVGASGDLARKKIFPALYALYHEGMLPEVRFCDAPLLTRSGFATWSDEFPATFAMHNGGACCRSCHEPSDSPPRKPCHVVGKPSVWLHWSRETTRVLPTPTTCRVCCVTMDLY
jgi:hypothetical protein